MRKKKIIGVITLLLIVISFFGIAQSSGWIAWPNKKTYNELDGQEELRKLYSHYTNATRDFDISGVIYLYDKENNNALKEKTPFRNVKSGNKYFTQISFQKTYILDTVVLQLDTVNRFITVSKINPDFFTPGNQSSFPFQQFMADTADFKIKATVSDKGEERVLKIKNELTPEIKEAVIYYNPNDYTIIKTEIEWWKEQNVREKIDEKKCWLSRISYVYNKSSSFDIANEMTSVVTIKDQNIKPTEKYKDYQITVR